MRRILLLIALLLAAPVLAQDAKPAPYTEIEALKIQNVNLEGAIVRRAVDDWQKKVAALKAELEKARPGFVWNPEDGSWAPVSKQ